MGRSFHFIVSKYMFVLKSEVARLKFVKILHYTRVVFYK
jgi:hypothetical protein